MGTPRSRDVVLDAGALIAVERGDRRVMALMGLAPRLHIPAGALAQVWRDPARQVLLGRFLAAEQTVIHDLTEERAKAAGVVCRGSGSADAIDASVVVLAREVDGSVLTSDSGDLVQLAPDLRVISV